MFRSKRKNYRRIEPNGLDRQSATYQKKTGKASLFWLMAIGSLGVCALTLSYAVELAYEISDLLIKLF